MLCCIALSALVLLGPRGVKVYRILRHRAPVERHRRPVNEPVTSGHLVVTSIDRSSSDGE